MAKKKGPEGRDPNRERDERQAPRETSRPIEPDEAPASPEPEPLELLTKDLREAAKLMKKREARYLVYQYYAWQKNRVASGNQLQAAKKFGEPGRVMDWLNKNTNRVENNVKRALDAFGQQYRVGRWLKSIKGIGPIFRAALLTILDVYDVEVGPVARFETAGSFWQFAGLNNQKWEKGQARPWHATLKKLAYLMGESFVKVKTRPGDYYGQLFDFRKGYEVSNNRTGRLVSEAQRALSEKNWSPNTESIKWYTGCYPPEIWDGFLDLQTPQRQARMAQMRLPAGRGLQMLPPSHIHARARRWTVKLFFSHVHHAFYSDFYGVDPPAPFIIQRPDLNIPKGDGTHTHYIGPPNWPWPAGDGQPLQELYVGYRPLVTDDIEAANAPEPDELDTDDD